MKTKTADLLRTIADIIDLDDVAGALEETPQERPQETSQETPQGTPYVNMEWIASKVKLAIEGSEYRFRTLSALALEIGYSETDILGTMRNHVEYLRVSVKRDTNEVLIRLA